MIRTTDLAVELDVDLAADAAYLRFGTPPGFAPVARTDPCDPSQVDGMINLDFDAEGRLIGIEILDAHAFLPPSIQSDSGGNGREP